jgi:phosphoenolpyruvate synthase/pyruvate phosphate dikinase
MLGISKGRISPADQLVLYHEDFAQKDVSEALVGRKGYSLFRLREMDLPVPDFFVVSPSVFKSHLLASFDGKLSKLLEKMEFPDLHELEKLISRAEFEDEFLDELASAYSRISGFSKAWVAVRSSIVYPQDKSVSFGGLFKTELNVRGFDHLVEGIKQVYISVFRDRVARYANNHDVKLADLQMSVVVQKMVQPEVAGVAYTIDPITNNKDRIGVEAVFGLGDVIADGEITPDQYLLNKKDLKIIEKHISPQEWMKIRKPRMRNSKEIEEFEKIQISKSWSHQQKLEDRHLELVSKLALIVEDKSNVPQAVEWVWESGGVWILQTKDLVTPQKVEAVVSIPKEVADKQSKPVTTEQSLYDMAVDVVKEGKEKDIVVRSHNLANAVEEKTIEKQKLPKALEREVKKSEEELTQRGYDVDENVDAMIDRGELAQPEDKKDAQKEIKEMQKDKDSIDRLEKLERKLTAVLRKNATLELKSKTVESAKSVSQIKETGLEIKPKEKDLQFLLSGIGASYGHVVGTVKTIKDGSEIITKENIIVIKHFDRNIENRILEAGGVIMDEGGITSDVALLCRENRIPAVVGTAVASAILKNGDVVKIDGNVGSVYRAGQEASEIPQDANEKVDPSDEVKASDKTEKVKSTVVKDEVQFELPRTATKVFLKPDISKPVSEYAGLLKAVDGVSCVDLEGLMLQGKRHPLSHVENKTFSSYVKPIEKYVDEITDLVNGNEVIATIGAHSSGEFKELIKGKAFEPEEVGDLTFGAARLTKNLEFTRRALGIVKRLRNSYKSRNVSLGIHAPMSGTLLTEIKKEVSSLGLRRTSTFNIFAVLDKSSEAVLVQEIASAQIDGVIINAKRIAKEIQGVAQNDDKSEYEVDSTSVVHLIDEAVSRLKGSNTKVILATDNNEALIKLAIKSGIYGIIVDEEAYADSKEMVASEEAKMIMSIGR